MRKKIAILTSLMLLIFSMTSPKQVTAFKKGANSLKTVEQKKSIRSVAPPAAINAVFPDQNLAEVIRTKLGKASITDTVTPEELSSIGALEGKGKNITNIEGVQYLSRIFSLELSGNNIADLSPLASASLPALRHLFLNNNQISDISVLSTVSFPLLQGLQLEYNQISDISVLSSVNFPILTVLILSHNQIRDISTFSSVNFPLLYLLYISNNQINNIGVSPWSSMTNVDRILLAKNQISDIRALTSTDFSSLTLLELVDNQISDISSLASAKFPAINSLQFNGNKISDISVLSSVNFPNASLSMSGQKIINQQVMWNSPLNVPNNIFGIDGQPLKPSVIYDSGTYNEPTLTWTVPKGTSTVRNTFSMYTTLDEGSTVYFAGTVTQPIVEGKTINYFSDNQIYQTEQMLEGAKLTEPTAPTKIGYNFIGWNTTADGTGLMWNFATDTVPANDLNLYAHWEVVVTPEENTGDLVTENTGNQVIENVGTQVIENIETQIAKNTVTDAKGNVLVQTGELTLEYLFVGILLLLGGSTGIFIIKKKRYFLKR